MNKPALGYINSQSKALKVVLHARQQQRRKRKPSMTYYWWKNPKKALEVAKASLSTYTASNQEPLGEAVRKALEVAKLIERTVTLKFRSIDTIVKANSVPFDLICEIGCKIWGDEFEEMAILLDIVYDCNGDSYNHVQDVQKGITSLGCSLADFGTNTAELERLARLSHRQAALDCIKYAKKPLSGSHLLIKDAVEEAKMAGCHLANLRISKKKLALIANASCERSIFSCIKLLRASDSRESAETYLEMIREYAAESGHDLKHFRTNEKQLMALMQNKAEKPE